MPRPLDSPPRAPVIDVLRGLAVAQMIAYHFIYDLGYFGWIRVAMTRDTPWIAWRGAIVSQFLLVAGLGLALRAGGEHAPGGTPAPSSFWPRWRQVAGAALLVSAGSWLVFRERLIWFGILHFIACALLLLRRGGRLGVAGLAAGGVVALAAGLLLQAPMFDQASLSWLGFATRKPPTEDYVPLFPWLGVVALGMAAGLAWDRRGRPLPAALRRLDGRPPRLLHWLGSWPLSIYLLHQPILMGLLWLVSRSA